MNKLIISLLGIMFFISCTQKADVLEFQPEGATNADIPYYVTNDGALSFRSLDDYSELCDSLIYLSEEEYANWEKRLGFTSYRSMLKNVMDEIENSDNQQYEALLHKYANIVCLNSDSLIVPVVESQLYRNIVNKESVFYVKGIKNVVSKKMVFAFVEDKEIFGESYIVTGEQTKGLPGSEMIEEYPYYETTWDEKKIATKASVYKIVGTSGSAMLIGQRYLELYAQGYKMKRGKYKSYSTIIYFDDIIYRMKDVGGRIAGYTYPDVTSGGETAIYSVVLPKVWEEELLCLHYRARTRETGNIGVGYNVYNHTWYDYKNANLCDVHPAVSGTK